MCGIPDRALELKAHSDRTAHLSDLHEVTAFVEAARVVVSFHAEAERRYTRAACRFDERLEQAASHSFATPLTHYAHTYFWDGGAEEAEARIMDGEEPKPGSPDWLIVFGDETEVTGLRPVRGVVRQLRGMQHVVA